MKLVVNIEPAWFHGVRTVEVDLDPEEFEGYTPDEMERAMGEIAQDVFNNEVSYGWEVVDNG